MSHGEVNKNIQGAILGELALAVLVLAIGIDSGYKLVLFAALCLAMIAIGSFIAGLVSRG